MKTYEDILDAMYVLYSDAFSKALPVNERMRALWSDPDRLDWIAIGQEQESWYLNFACGDAIAERASVRGYLSNVAEYLDNDRTRGDELLDMIRYELIDWEPFEEEYDASDDQAEMNEFIIFSALYLTILKLRKRLLPSLNIALADPVEMTVFDDIEASCFEASRPEYDGEELTKKDLLEMPPTLCREQRHRDYLTTLLKLDRKNRESALVIAERFV
ncbi:hypothetical protein HCH_04435 [Hahella chejuensis KCTC 2396]|uniref:Uncharacterized protein n=1 Tax=Hahella chejuensis (strain KCTC 2396) TaxID=349521 RepID=Q2SDY5_HAHCH|nr:hypothetical protein [Hahella chejuensis]ABC31139.1 hypothetical protein HCH_04435 [Hahella chejuensis KCTC 2396]